MTIKRILGLVLSSLCIGASAVEPVALELSGRLDGAPFWARRLPPSAAYGGNQILQLVYTPPAPEHLDGTHLIDCPFILLDARARLVAWNGRSTLSFITLLERGAGYHISREIETGTGDDKQIQAQEQNLTLGRQWDLRLLPLHLALVWTASGTGHETALDFFVAKPPPPIDIRWSPGTLTIGTATWRVDADAQGFVTALTDDTGRARIQVTARKP